MQVRVFRNLTRRCYSVQAKVGGTWRTAAHAEWVTLGNARFLVSEAGRQRVLRTGAKNVHACVQGELLGWQGVLRIALALPPPKASPVSAPVGGARVSYNPQRCGNFMAEGRIVSEAALVHFAPEGVTANCEACSG